MYWFCFVNLQAFSSNLRILKLKYLLKIFDCANNVNSISIFRFFLPKNHLEISHLHVPAAERHQEQDDARCRTCRDTVTSLPGVVKRDRTNQKGKLLFSLVLCRSVLGYLK